MKAKNTIKNLSILMLIACNTLIMIGCVPPMRFSSSIDVPSPDGQVNLEVSSVTWSDMGMLIGPEPPRISSCMGSISGGSFFRGEAFTINIEANFQPATSALNKIDVIWAPDSKYFAVTTPIDISIYDKSGNLAQKYELGAKKRVSTVHWKADEGHGFYAVIKERIRDLPPLLTFFSPTAFRVFYGNPEKKRWDEFFYRKYIDGIKSDSFVPNYLGAKRFGEEFQEISPDSRYFIFSDEAKIRFYDLLKNQEGVLFNYTGRLTWIWWINKECALLNITRDKDQYIIYNMTTGKSEDLSIKILSLPYNERCEKNWYKSLSCY